MFITRRGFGKYEVVNHATGDVVDEFSGAGSKARAEARATELDTAELNIELSLSRQAAAPRRRVRGRIR